MISKVSSSSANEYKSNPLIPKIFSNDHICVFGTDYDTPDGSCVRDYIHVADLADGHIMVMGRSANDYNLGSGTGYSVLQIINECEKVCGKKINVVYGDRRSGDPASLVADCSKIMEIGWHPKHDLSSIIKTAWMWHKNKNEI